MNALRQFLRKLLPNSDLWIIGLGLFVLYFVLALLTPRNIVWSLDEGGKVLYIQNVLRTGSPIAPLEYPGRALDSALQNVPLYFHVLKGGQIYSWWPVGFPLLTLPFYALMGWYGLYLLPALAGAATALLSSLLARLLTGQSRAVGIATALAVGVASPVAFYSVTFWEHTLAVALAMLSLYILFARRDSMSWKWLALAGAAGSLAVFFRTEIGLVIAGAGLVFVAQNWKKAVPFAAAGGITAAVWIAFNLVLMGHPIGRNFAAADSSASGLLNAGLKYVPYVLFNVPIISAFSLGKSLLIIGTVAVGLSVLFGTLPRTRLWSIPFLVIGSLICAYVLFQPGMYRSVHGFILICPLVLAGVWVFRSPAWQEHRWFWLLLIGGMGLYAAGYVYKAWLAAGGLQWGPRYMLILYPLLIIPAVVGLWTLVHQARGWARAAFAGAWLFAVLIGLGFQIRGYASMLLTMHLYEQSAEVMHTLKDEVVSTNCTWMPMVIPDLYWQGNVFAGAPGKPLLDNLSRVGITSYLDVQMISCSTTYLDEVLRLLPTTNHGLVINRVPINSAEAK